LRKDSKTAAVLGGRKTTAVSCKAVGSQEINRGVKVCRSGKSNPSKETF